MPCSLDLPWWFHTLYCQSFGLLLFYIFLLWKLSESSQTNSIPSHHLVSMIQRIFRSTMHIHWINNLHKLFLFHIEPDNHRTCCLHFPPSTMMKEPDRSAHDIDHTHSLCTEVFYFFEHLLNLFLLQIDSPHLCMLMI